MICLSSIMLKWNEEREAIERYEDTYKAQAICYGAIH